MYLFNKMKELMNRNSVIYSSELCSDCQLAESFFTKNNIDIEIKKIENPEYQKELETKYGKVLVPTIIIGGEKFIGFKENQERIKKKLNLGE